VKLQLLLACLLGYFNQVSNLVSNLVRSLDPRILDWIKTRFVASRDPTAQRRFDMHAVG
jgi:hypothetical protein